MADATREEIAKALALWSVAQQGKTPEQWEGFINKYSIQNPFDPWPPTKEKLDAFVQKFQDTILQNTEAKINITSEISAKKLEGLVDEFNNEYGRVAEIHNDAEARAKGFVSKLQAEQKAQRLREVINQTIELQNVPPEHKSNAFKEMARLKEENPTTSIEKISEKTVSVLETAPSFLQNPDASDTFVKQQFSFSKLKNKNIFQSAIAPLADVVLTIAPGLRQGTFNKELEYRLKDILNTPNRIIDYLGIRQADVPAFKGTLHAIHPSVEQRPVGPQNLFSGLFSSIFGKAIDTRLMDGVGTYWEIRQSYIIRGETPPTANQFMASGMGLGKTALHFGADYLLSKGRVAVVNAGLAKLGLAAIPGPGWITALLALGGSALGKLGTWLLGRRFKSSMVPGDKEILTIGCGSILLVFFLLPIISQLNIDSSLVTNLNMGGGGPLSENQYMDTTITATPATLIGNRPTAIRYSACVKPKGSPASFKINSVQVKFSVYGFQGNSGLNDPEINPASFSNGCYTFTVPIGPQLENTVIAASFIVNADAGTNVGVSGFASASTVIGNPTNDILIPGTGGYQPGGWCNKDGASVPWGQSDWGTMLGAVATLSKYPNYLGLVRQYNPAGITMYRINWTGNYWGCTSADATSIMFIYNGGIPHATYILTHELGHRISASEWFGKFKADGITSEGVTRYAGGYGGEERISEDFAETFALYVTDPNGLRASLPNHYAFAQRIMGGQ